MGGSALPVAADRRTQCPFSAVYPRGKQVLNLLEVLKIPKKGQLNPLILLEGTRMTVVAVVIHSAFMARQVLFPAFLLTNSQQPHEVVTIINPK